MISNQESVQLAAYGRELDIISEALTALHPIGNVKAIGRLECVSALVELLEMIAEGEHSRGDCRDVASMARNLASTRQ